MSTFGLRFNRRDGLLLLPALVLLLACVQMPSIRVDRPVYDFQVSFDISQSMNVEDVEIAGTVVSRLDLAKAAARGLLRGLPCGSRIGWSAFTGRRAFTLLTPLEVCRHHEDLLSALEQIDGRMRWFEGSKVGKGLHQGMHAALEIGEGTALIFITDGHEAPPLRPGQTGFPTVDPLDVKGLLVGVGGKVAVRIPRTDSAGRQIGYWQSADVVQHAHLPTGQGREHLSRLYEEYLIKLAQHAKLAYLELNSAAAIADAVQIPEFAQPRAVPVDLRWVPALLALVLLCWRFQPIA